MEELQQKFERLKGLYNELNDKFAQCEEELIKYKSKFVPKYELKDKLFFLNVATREVESLVVDEIGITKLGVFYREFTSETELRQIPETLCFASEDEVRQKIKETEEA